MLSVGVWKNVKADSARATAKGKAFFHLISHTLAAPGWFPSSYLIDDTYD